jgi:2-polyprenyl-3-methyl-5-hydroxy-6-metoxy-1,4-benzoquinol methylase
MNEINSANQEARIAWERNASFWDSRMGEGNDFINLLIWPATEKLLAPGQGERILDIACGNGLTSRRLAEMGANVTAFDFSAAMIEIARIKPTTGKGSIEYSLLDATDYEQLVALGERSFDAALCNMALFDMADIRPLFLALAKLLRRQGRFVFSIIHPCFNNPSSVHQGELEDRDGELVATYSVKISRYLTSYIRPGLAIAGQPVPHPYFHRPLTEVLRTGFEAGFVLDGFEERAFPPDHLGGSFELSWSGRFSEIPPVIVGRMKKSDFGD